MSYVIRLSVNRSTEAGRDKRAFRESRAHSRQVSLNDSVLSGDLNSHIVLNITCIKRVFLLISALTLRLFPFFILVMILFFL